MGYLEGLGVEGCGGVPGVGNGGVVLIVYGVGVVDVVLLDELLFA